jgi:hypothetical protein
LEGEKEIELEIRFVWNVNDPGDAEVRPPAEVEGSSYGVLIAEIFPGHGVADDDGMRVGQGFGGIPLKEGKGKHFKKGWIDGQKTCFRVGLIFVADDHVVGTIAGEGGDFGERIFEGRPEREGEPGMDRDVVVEMIFHDHAIDISGIPMEPVIGKLVLHPEKDEDGAGDPSGQAVRTGQEGGLVRLPIGQGELDDPALVPKIAD